FLWKEIVSELKVFDGVTAHCPCRWIEPHGFREDHLDITQPWNIAKCGQAAIQLACNFFVKSSFTFRILRQQIPCPAKSIGYGLLSRQKNCDDLIAEGLLRGLAAVGQRSQHKVEKATAFPPSLAVGGDHAMYNCIDTFSRSNEGSQSRRAHVHQPFCQRQ